MTRKKLSESIVMLLGGRAAEALVLDDICTGASNDMERATKIAKNMVTKWGFSELGPVVYGSDNDEVFIGRDYGHVRDYSEEIASRIDAEVRKLVENGYEQAKEILSAHRDQLDALAEYLIEYEKASEEEFEQIMKGELTVATRMAKETPAPPTAPETPAASDSDEDVSAE